MRRLVAVALVVVSAGCSLPLSHGVMTVGAGSGERRSDGGIQVLPPGPTRGQAPEDIVQGFLGAQANSAQTHGIARQFLTTAEASVWNDDAGVQVYDPERLGFQALPGPSADQITVQVTSVLSAEVRPDGSYTAVSGPEKREDYQLRKVSGDWRLSNVPAGLRLTSADLARSYQPSVVYYLATSPGAVSRLVPDRVFLPIGREPVRALVDRLVAPPSAELADTVTTAVPGRTAVRSVAMNNAGVVTVDLSSVVSALSSAARQSLSAQLIWTLRGLGPAFTGMRLLTGGKPLVVPTEGSVQDAGDWSAFDPEGLGPNPPYYFVAGRRLQASVSLPSGQAAVGDANGAALVPVDQVAVTPDRSQVALLAGNPAGAVTVSTGPLRGPSYARGPTAVGLTSPSWGSGQYGLWMLRAHQAVVLLPSDSRVLQPVAVTGLPAGPLTSLALSRDGTRIALVAHGALYVGRVLPSGASTSGVPSVTGLALVLPGLTQVRGVAWTSGTELAVLGALASGPQVLRVAVDGSAVVTLNSGSLRPVAIAASSAGLIVESGGALWAVSGRGFVKVQAGSAPIFPG